MREIGQAIAEVGVGTLVQNAQAPVAYEVPREVVAEGIVNAVAHRDYSSNGSVQVMLFADRLEVWNPGRLPSSLTLARLRQPHGSVPHNPLLAEPLYLTQYIERLGTGTGDMIRRCRAAGLKEPEFTISDGFALTIWRVPAAEMSGNLAGNLAGKVAGKVAGKIIELIRENPAITIPELAKALKKPERTTERLLQTLKTEEIIGRIGPARGGRWEVLE